MTGQKPNREGFSKGSTKHDRVHRWGNERSGLLMKVPCLKICYIITSGLCIAHVVANENHRFMYITSLAPRMAVFFSVKLPYLAVFARMAIIFRSFA